MIIRPKIAEISARKVDIRKPNRGLASMLPLILLFSTAFSTILFFAAPTPVAHASLYMNSTPSNAGSSLSQGLVGWWTFDGKDMKNNVADRSGQGNHGYMSGFTSTSSAQVAGKLGQGLKFDGGDDNLNINSPASLNLNNNYSISFWVNRLPGSTGTIIRESSSVANSIQLSKYEIRVSGTSVSFITGDGTTGDNDAFTATIADNKWLMVSCTLTTDNIKSCYLNGSLITTAYNDVDTSLITTLTNGRIGTNRNSAGQNFFEGSLDDVRIYSRALSAAEVKALYNQGQSKINATAPNNPTLDLNTGLVGYWTFDAKDMKNNVADRSGSGNHGYMSGFTSTSSAQVVGRAGQGLKFRSSQTQYVESPNTSSLNITGNGLTASVWVRSPTAPGNYLSFITKANTFGTAGYTLYTGSTGNARFVAGTGSASLTNDVGNILWDDHWHMVTGTYDGTWTSIYVDGVFDNRVAGSGNIADNSASTLDIGIHTNKQSTTAFEGSLDEARVYSRALSAAEVKALYNQGQSKINATAPNNPALTLNTGLVGYWTFDAKDMKNNVADRSGSSPANNGYMVGFGATSTAVTAGKLGQGLKFDGVDDYVSTADYNWGFNEPYSISVWFNPSSLSNMGVLLGKPYWEYQLELANSTLRWAQYDTGGSAQISVNTSLPSANRWYHTVITHDGTTATMYLNGVSKSTDSSFSGTSRNTANKLDIGAGWAHNQAVQQYYFSGTLDDVRIYSRALSASEVKQLYNMGR